MTEPPLIEWLNVKFMNTHTRLLEISEQMYFTTKRRTVWTALVLLIAVFCGWKLYPYAVSRQPQVYKIARDTTWYPVQLLGKERSMVAFSNELLFAIARNEHFQLELISVPSGGLLHGLEKGQYTGILTALAPTIENQRKYLFSEIFYLIGPVMVVPIHSPYQSLQEMAGKTVGFVPGTNLSFKIDLSPSFLILSYDTPTAAIADLERNVLDGVILDLFLAYAYINGPYAGKLRLQSGPMTQDGLRLVTRKTSEGESLIAAFNAGLEKMKAEGGVCCTLKDKWGLP